MPGRHLGGGVLGQATGPRPADGPPVDQAGAEAAWIGLGCRMDEASIAQYIATTFAGVDVVVASQEGGAPEVAWGDTFFIYDPDRTLVPTRQFPFATIVTHDYGDFDKDSRINRPGVFRLNIGIGKETYQSLFGAGREYDFAALDQLMPHPVYGRNHWACVLNPSDSTFEAVKPLVAEAYDIAVRRYKRPGAGRDSG
jgi:uncharacterized protein DUF6194